MSIFPFDKCSKRILYPKEDTNVLKENHCICGPVRIESQGVIVSFYFCSAQGDELILKDV